MSRGPSESNSTCERCSVRELSRPIAQIREIAGETAWALASAGVEIAANAVTTAKKECLVIVSLNFMANLEGRKDSVGVD